MSIISSVFTREAVYIVTDTLAARYAPEGGTPFPGIIANFTSKIIYYPHLKCCICTLGSKQLSSDHHEFINSNYFNGLEDLYIKTSGQFCDNLDRNKFMHEPGNNLIGCIMIFGYNEVINEMEVYRISINHDKTKDSKKEEIPTEPDILANFMAPRLSQEDEQNIFKQCETEDSEVDVVKVLIEVSKKMHENSLNAETYVYPVGGELNLTILTAIDGQLYCNNAIVHRFPDYEENNKKMKKRLHPDPLVNDCLENLNTI